MIRKRLLLGLVFTMVLGLTSIPTFAADPTLGITAPANVTIGTYTVSNFGSTLLDGLRQTTTFTTTDMTVVDARGTGAGWSVNLTATRFINNTAANDTATATLPASSLALGTVSIVADADATVVTNIAILQGAIDKTGGVKILNTPINEGMGTYVVSIGASTLTLLPRNAKAGTYTSTITLTLSQGPVA